MQLLAVGVAAMAAISLMVTVVNWLIAHWWVLAAAALILLLGALGWWQHRTQRAQWQQAQARALRYGLAQCGFSPRLRCLRFSAAPST
ncbi:hypothetical protein [Streptomyces levis]|uniref:hypothetical protein n=1 Tax=Streptomyces levis TaxID=285566 RepID=UPI003C7E164B